MPMEDEAPVNAALLKVRRCPPSNPWLFDAAAGATYR